MTSKRLFSVILSLCVACAAVFASAIGDWTNHSVFAAPPQQIVDTGSTIYYLSGGSLFSYDKKSDESFSFTTSNRLSAPTATGIFYNPEGKILLVAYSTGNIDLIHTDSGRLVNLPDIAESSIAPPLTINDVAFAGDRIYVATSFGLVEFSASRHEVVQSGIYSTPVSALTVVGQDLVVWVDGSIRSVPCGERFPSLSYFRTIALWTMVDRFLPVDENCLVAVNRNADGSRTFYRVTINFDSGTLLGYSQISSHSSSLSVSAASDGCYYYVAEGKLFALTKDNIAETVVAVLPEEFDGAVCATATGRGEMWTLTRDGLACHSFAGGGAPTLLSDRFRPEEFTVKEVCYMTPSPDGRRLYVTNNGTSAYRFDIPGAAGYDKALTASVIDLASEEFRDITPYGVDAELPDNVNRQKRLGKYLFSPTGIAEDPDDANTFYVSTTVDGLYKFTAGEYVGRFNEKNSPLEIRDNRNIVYHANIDRAGNLWLHSTTLVDDASPLFILPAAKRRLPPDQIKPSDWIIPDTKSVSYLGGHDIQPLHHSNRRISIILDHNSGYHFLVYDNNGTPSDFSDDRLKLWTRLVDQDGNTFDPSYCSAICEDRNGTVWIGTSQGVFTISSAVNAMNDNMTVRRVKVPKNDGTNTAEYLLGSDLIYSISVDAANRKWIATEASGLFLVSADGSEILENFTTANSPLPSNKIYCVYADPVSGRIYVGTEEGLYSYVTNAMPALDGYDDIVVYPNPVTPDYSGPIYVKGLMEGSLVKITDASGTVVCQGRAEGGLFSWNGTNSAGARLPSGVYYVFASQNANGSPSGGTAKFMIIR
ncbi:MAG: hypothetical protein K2G01_03485 [Paramuribaculum sp.]|nr:hypothetical protein [Paramuribaculum sp.]